MHLIASGLAALSLAVVGDLYGLEVLLVIAALVVAARSRRFGEQWFARAEGALSGFAERRVATAFAVGIAALVFRLALLPINPIPHPVVPDEFSHLLLAETLAQHRLTNLPHHLWPSFETLHVLQRPTYASMYFPGPALLLLLGIVTTGIPWFGLLIGTSALCGLICWALQAWFPARWALLGGAIAVLKIGLISYWVDSFWGGTFAALGGTLVLGALPRLQRRPNVGLAVVTSVGIAMLANSRPYEGVAFCVPVAVRLSTWLIKDRDASVTTKFIRIIIPIAVCLALVGGAMGIYFKAVTGSPFVLPYTVNQQRFGWPMTLPWTDIRYVQHQRPEFADYFQYEVGERLAFTSPMLFLARLVLNIQQDWRFYIGPALTIPLLFVGKCYRSRRLRFLYLTLAVVLFAVYMEPHFPHYMAPITMAVIAVLVQGYRYLRQYQFRGVPVGLRISRVLPLILVGCVAFRVAAASLHVPYQRWGGYTSWCCSNEGSVDQNAVLRLLPHSGKHVILVHYNFRHKFLEEWVYNEPDIDKARAVWARELGGYEDRRVIEYFRDRQIWQFDPDVKPRRLVPLETQDPGSEPQNVGQFRGRPPDADVKRPE